MLEQARGRGKGMRRPRESRVSPRGSINPISSSFPAIEACLNYLVRQFPRSGSEGADLDVQGNLIATWQGIIIYVYPAPAFLDRTSAIGSKPSPIKPFIEKLCH